MGKLPYSILYYFLLMIPTHPNVHSILFLVFGYVSLNNLALKKARIPRVLFLLLNRLLSAF